MEAIIFIPSFLFVAWIFWIVAASICKMFWRFYYSGGPFAGFFGAVVGYFLSPFVSIHEYWITGSGFMPTIKEKIVCFHKEMHLWIRATLNPSQREEILGMKLFAPQVQRMARFLEDSERDFLVRKFLAERGDEDTGDG
jgi:hypothetical protein